MASEKKKDPKPPSRRSPVFYSDDMPERVLKLMREGFSKEAVAGELGCSRASLYRWYEDYPEFKEAIEQGEVASLFFYEKKLIRMIDKPAKDTNATALIYLMKCRFRAYGYGQEAGTAVLSDQGQEVKITFVNKDNKKPKE